MKIYIIPLVLFLTLGMAPQGYCQDTPEPQRGFSLDAGIGWQPFISYPSLLQNAMDTLNSIPGVGNTQINLNLDIGYYIGTLRFRDASTAYYFTAGVDGYARRLEDSSGSIQVNNYIYDLGIQAVSGHIYSRVALGSAVAVAQISGSGVNLTTSSKSGFGLDTRIMWDFGSGFGWGLGLGINATTSIIEGDIYSSLGIDVSALYL